MGIKDIFDQIAGSVIPQVGGYRSRILELPVSLKSDNTLLTEADTAVQLAILQIIRKHDKSAYLIAEEAHRLPVGIIDSRFSWIVDPIDGTREFVSSECREFCTAICVLDAMQPVAALVIAHELGHGRSALVFEAYLDGLRLTVNDRRIAARPDRASVLPVHISLTRDSGKIPCCETLAETGGCKIKRRTTSQTLDLVRTALDLSDWTDVDFESFDLFYRPNQKIWDGAPGILFNLLAGKIAVDLVGRPLTPFSRERLRPGGRILPNCVVGQRNYVEWFRSLCAAESQ